MTTQYTNSVTIAVPAPLIDDANHIALLLGECRRGAYQALKAGNVRVIEGI